MSTMTASRKASKSARPFSCAFVSITIAINDTRYSADPIEPGEFGTKAFRLAKHSGDHAAYDVIRHHDGVVACDCPDYVARHEGNGYGTCKHGRALVELGLMPAPIAPAKAPQPGPEAAVAVGDVPTVPTPAAAPEPAQAAPVVTTIAPATETPTPGIETDPFPPDRLDPWDAEAPPELWPDATDADTWELGPDVNADPEPTEADLADMTAGFAEMEARDFLDASERLTLAELVQRQVDFYAGWKNAAGAMLAAAMTELLFKIRLVDASTPAELADRLSILDADNREQLVATGYADGLAAGRREGAGYTGPLD